MIFSLWTQLAIALAISVPVAALVVVALFRSLTPPSNTALEIYRRQLAEVDHDVSSGQISQTDAAATRNVIARRMLASDREFRKNPSPGSASRSTTLLLSTIAFIVLVPGTILLYLLIGQPGMPDQPFAKRLAAIEDTRLNRPSQEERLAELQQIPQSESVTDVQTEELVARLRQVIAEYPDDARGLELLARHEALLGNHMAAAEAQQQLIDVLAASAGPDQYAQLAEFLILAAAGYVSPEAEQALDAALQINPQQVRARYYIGLMHAQTGRPDLAFASWQIISELDETPPEIKELLAELFPVVAAQAGIRYSAPPANPVELSQEQIEDAAQLTEAERQEMIANMVEGLETRLEQEGGSADEHAKLIWSLHILGRTQRAIEAWKRARNIFADSQTELAAIDQAARAAGLTP